MPQTLRCHDVRCERLNVKQIIYGGVPLESLLVPHERQEPANPSAPDVGAWPACKLPTPVTPGEVLMAGEGGSVFFHPLPDPPRPPTPIERPCACAAEIMELRLNMARMELAIERLLFPPTDPGGAGDGGRDEEDPEETESIMTTSSDSNINIGASGNSEEVILMPAEKKGRYWVWKDLNNNGKEHRCRKKDCVLVDGEYKYPVRVFIVVCRVILTPLSDHSAVSIGQWQTPQMAAQQAIKCGDAHSLLCTNHGAYVSYASLPINKRNWHIK